MKKAGLFKRLRRDQRGLTTVEYAIVLCLIAVSTIGLWNTLGTNLATKVHKSGTAVGELQVEERTP